MSIFVIILITFLISVLVLCVFGLIWAGTDNDGVMIAGVIVSVAIWIGSTFIGIGLNTESERTFVAGFNAQKVTIEESLQAESLTGLERIDLVSKAAELNAEMAERKVIFNLWHTVYYDNTIYDDVELICISKEK